MVNKKIITKKEQITGFNESYKLIKKRGFENYFCLPETTWKEAKQNFDNGAIILDEISILLDPKKGERIPICSKCKRIMDPQEYKSGFRECEHCQK